MFRERVIEFVTDLPKSPKDMAERLKRVPLWYKSASLITVASLAACQLGERFGFVTPPPESTQTPPTETVPPNSFPIATAATEINSYGQYEFIEQSEIEANLKEPYEHFKNNPDVKALFNDSGTIEYSAMGIRVYLQGGGHTNYIFFEASSETEEKGYIAMVFGGGQPGEISYSVLNRIVDSNGMVGLGLTSDIGGNRLENPVMIFNTGLTEKEISQLTADDLLKRDILFIPGGVKVPSERIIGAKPLFSLLPVEPTPTPEFPPLPQEFLSQIPADKQYEIANGQVLVDGQVWFEMNSAGEWQDKRPLYWQCGPKTYPNSWGSVEEEAKILPTGLISNGEFGAYTYLKAITARACLTKLNDFPDPLFPDVAVRGKVVFFDLDGKAYEYSIMMGAVDNSGREHGLSIGTFTSEGRFYRGMSIKEALPILEKYYNFNASKQVDIDFATKDGGAPWILGKYINQNRELTVQLIEALKTGRGFPEDVPEEFFLWIIQVQFMLGFVP